MGGGGGGEDYGGKVERVGHGLVSMCASINRGLRTAGWWRMNGIVLLFLAQSRGAGRERNVRVIMKSVTIN